MTNVAGTRGRRSLRAAQKMHPATMARWKPETHQHVKGAGALKAHAQGMGEISAVAGDHGGQHDGVVLGEAQRVRQPPHGRGQGQQARA